MYIHRLHNEPVLWYPLGLILYTSASSLPKLYGRHCYEVRLFFAAPKVPYHCIGTEWLRDEVFGLILYDSEHEKWITTMAPKSNKMRSEARYILESHYNNPRQWPNLPWVFTPTARTEKTFLYRKNEIVTCGALLGKWGQYNQLNATTNSTSHTTHTNAHSQLLVGR